MIQSRIDRIYVPAPMAEVGGTTEILPEISDISDHSGVVMHYNNSGPRKHRQPFFNRGLLKHPESLAALVSTWRAVMEDTTIENWNKNMVAANKAIPEKSEELTREYKQRWKATYLDQFAEIIEAEEELQRNWGSREARDRLSDAQAKLHEVRHQKFQFKESATLSKWTRVGDRCTKEFFEHFTGRRRQIIIKQLLEGETLLTTQPELERHILSFYEGLYTLDEQVENNSTARVDCLHFIQKTVSTEHNEDLLRPLS